MSTTNRILRRQLDRELTNLENQYLAMRDLKSDGALGGLPLATIMQFDDAVESLAEVMQHLRNTISLLDATTDSQDQQG